jgi:hypothetical protein
MRMGVESVIQPWLEECPWLRLVGITRPIAVSFHPDDSSLQCNSAFGLFSRKSKPFSAPMNLSLSHLSDLPSWVIEGMAQTIAFIQSVPLYRDMFHRKPCLVLCPVWWENNGPHVHLDYPIGIGLGIVMATLKDEDWVEMREKQEIPAPFMYLSEK